MSHRSHLLLCSFAAGVGLLAAASSEAYVLAGPGTALTAHSTDWSWDGGAHLAAYRNAIADSARFGAGATVPVAITTLDLAAIDDALDLAAADGFVAPFWNDLDMPNAARSAIIEFFLAGGDLIVFQDSSRYDAIGSALGIPTVSGSTATLWNGGAPLFDGPFAATSNVGQLGLAGVLSAADIALTGGSIGATNTQGEITAAYWREGDYRPGAGNLLILTDIDTWSTWQGNANYLLMDNEARFALNSTAFVVIECGDGALDPGEGCDDGDISSGDGCDANCSVTGCGNGELTAAEQCDDGNLAAGDGCSAACLCESGGDGDGDGIPNACDNCPAVSNATQLDTDVDNRGNACDSCPQDPADDADGDGLCGDVDFCPFDKENDADLDGLCGDVDPCTNPSGERDIIGRAKLAFRFVYLDPTPGNDRVGFSGEFALPPGMLFSEIDPLTLPVRFRIEFADGTSPVDVVFPQATFTGSGTSGWVQNGKMTRWGFRDVTGQPDSGLVRFMLQDLGDGRVRAKLRGIDSDYLVTPSDTPLRVIVDFGSAVARECAEANWTSLDCRTTNLGQIISCRN